MKTLSIVTVAILLGLSGAALTIEIAKPALDLALQGALGH